MKKNGVVFSNTYKEDILTSKFILASNVTVQSLHLFFVYIRSGRNTLAFKCTAHQIANTDLGHVGKL